MYALRTAALTKTFDDGFTALSDVTLDVSPGEFVTLLGPSGCGKTTLLKTIAGFHAPTLGSIEIGGVDVTGAPPERRDTAMCFQSYALFPHLTVSQNIDFGPRQNRVAREERSRRLVSLLRQVDLEAHAGKLPNKLSGGQQQRVALARALALRPSIVLFDEPLSNLDAKLRQQVRHEIRSLQRELGFTAIYVTHDQSEALAMSDRIVVMRDGRVDQIGTPEDVYARPETAFVADFIGAANILPVEARVDGHRCGHRRIATPLGELVTADDQPADATHVCWRPQDAAPMNGPVNGPVNGGGVTDNVIEGEVSARAFQGAYAELLVRSGVAPAQRLHLPPDAPQVGERIAFRLPPDKIRFVRGDAA